MSPQHGEDAPRHQAITFQVPAAEKIAAPGDGHWEIVAGRVRLSDEIGAGLGDVVWMPSLKGQVLGIGLAIVFAEALSEAATQARHLHKKPQLGARTKYLLDNLRETGY